jgi:hypothetical protein
MWHINAMQYYSSINMNDCRKIDGIEVHHVKGCKQGSGKKSHVFPNMWKLELKIDVYIMHI